MWAYYLKYSNYFGYFAFIHSYRTKPTQIVCDNFTIYFNPCIIVMSVWKKLKDKISTTKLFLSEARIFVYAVL